MKSHRMPYIIYADLECLIKKIDGCENNPENSSTTRIGDHITCGYSKKYYICGKRIQKNAKDNEKLDIIVIIQGNTEAQRIVFVI